uniref:Uncharacterized protein n=1 Tax=Glossina morsitans morsitans TaxID=37546 RepID=A0A1B0FFW1_GLOMM
MLPFCNLTRLQKIAESSTNTSVVNNNLGGQKPVTISSTSTPALLHGAGLLPAAANVTAVCDGALLPRLGDNGKELEICPECRCNNKARNTTLIKVVVIIVIWIISILVIYMLFLMCLDPLLNKRVKANYQEHTNEDVHNRYANDDAATTTPPLPSLANQELNSRANVLNRVGHQQDKWKRQVREQRRHIYDRRTMLN